jgi:predicted hydrocarbon binding protein
MVDVEFCVTSDRREGLLLALGQVVIANGFTLLRQRLAAGADGVVLTMLVSGPQDNLLKLEDSLGSHPLVRNFEAAPTDDASSRLSKANVPAVSPPVASIPAARTSNAPAVDPRRVEVLLAQLARSYPNIFLHLHALERELGPEQCESTLRYIGQRVGAWVYKRDFALGAKLALSDAIRSIALPAMRQLVHAEVEGDILHVANSPFCHRGHAGKCCHFLRGMLGGLLAETHGIEHSQIMEISCRNIGAEVCSFECRT